MVHDRRGECGVGGSQAEGVEVLEKMHGMRWHKWCMGGKGTWNSDGIGVVGVSMHCVYGLLEGIVYMGRGSSVLGQMASMRNIGWVVHMGGLGMDEGELRCVRYYEIGMARVFDLWIECIVTTRGMVQIISR